MDRLLSEMTKQEENLNRCISKLKKTDYEKTRLIDDNVKLLGENEKLKQKLLNLTFMKPYEDEFESDPKPKLR